MTSKVRRAGRSGRRSLLLLVRTFRVVAESGYKITVTTHSGQMGQRFDRQDADEGIDWATLAQTAAASGSQPAQLVAGVRSSDWLASGGMFD